jgi:hypothetical protein
MKSSPLALHCVPPISFDGTVLSSTETSEFSYDESRRAAASLTKPPGGAPQGLVGMRRGLTYMHLQAGHSTEEGLVCSGCPPACH